MAVPFLSPIKLNKNQVEDFCIYNLANDPSPTAGADFGYFWLNTGGSKSLRWWDGTTVRTLLDSASSVTAANISGGAAGELLYQSGLATTAKLGVGTDGYILTYDGINTKPQWSASIPAGSVSGLAASATTDTTNAANITSGLLPLARLALENNKVYVGNGSNVPTATAKSTISLSEFGALTVDLDIAGFKIINSGDVNSGSTNSTLATKGYVDSVAQGLDIKASCLVASTADINLIAPGSGLIDGIDPATFTSGTTRILVKDQSLSQQNGIYIWNGTGSAMTRSLDANTWDELVGAFTFIETGTANADSGWVCNVNAGGNLGTTAVTWTKFSQAGSYTAGNGMVLSGGVFHFAQDTNYTAGRIPFASSTSAIGFNANLFWDNANSRLGIGTASPSAKLEVNDANGIPIRLGDIAAPPASQTAVYVGASTSALSGANGDLVLVPRTSDARSILFYTGSGTASLKATLNSDGNLGLGAVPVAADGAAKTFQVGGRTVIQSTVGTQTLFANNAYYDGAWKRIVEGYSNAIRFNGLGSSGANAGAITFSIAASGSAGSTITNWDSSDIRMVLDANGRLGIGTTTPSVDLEVGDSTGTRTVKISGNTSILNLGYGTIRSGPSVGDVRILSDRFRLYNEAGSQIALNVASTGATDWYTSGSLKMSLDSSGNLGLGVTPSAWGGGKSIDVGSSGAFYGDGLTYDWRVGATMNAYRKLAFNNWYYKTTGQPAGRYDVASGGSTGVVHTWQTAASGTADAQISWTTAMTLDASGNLLVGTTTATSKFVVSSSGDTLATIIGGAANAKGISFYDASTNGCQIYSVSSDIRFFTTASGSSTERLRIPSSGEIQAIGQGSASAPIFSRTGDTNTGLYFPAADTLALAVGGSDAVYIDSSRNVGIGTSSPEGFRLNVNTNVGTVASFKNSTAGSSANIFLSSNDRTFVIAQRSSTSDGGDLAYFYNSSPTPIAFFVNEIERLRIKSTGQLNFTGLAADPTGAAGDLYYSTGNVLKMHNGTAWQQVGRKYTAALNDGSVTVVGNAYTITHNMGSQDITISVRRTTDNAVVLTDVSMPSTTTATITFAAAITASQYVVTVIG